MVGLLAVAAVATRGDGTDSTAPPGTAAAASAGHHVFIIAAVVLTPILALLGMAFFLYAQIYRRRELDPEAQRQQRQRRIRAAVLAAVVLGLTLYYLRTGKNPLQFLHLHNPFGTVGQTRAHRPFAGRPGHPHPAVSGADWTVAVIVWAALVVAAVVIFARARGRTRDLAPFALADEAEPSAEPDLERLRRERNPRRAVIAAYAAMERHMAGEGLPRGPHEAPMEYLGRVTLHGHERVACVHRLTALFQRAKFSHRPVDDDMRLRAIAAVEELVSHGPGAPA
jgi:membrane protein implicated in regulation of membrane protease activity